MQRCWLLALIFCTSAAAPQPRAVLNVVSGSASAHYRGWPLVFSIALEHPDGARARYAGETVTPLNIAVPSGSWARLVKLVVRNAQGEVQSWPIQLVTSVGSSLTLDSNNSGRLSVILPGSATMNLSPGTYRLRLWVDTRTGATEASWKGVATDEMEIQLQGEPTVLSARQRCDKGYVSAMFHEAQGQLSQAISVLDTTLAGAPDEILCLAARAELAAMMGRTYEAIDFYKRASAEDPGGVLAASCQELTHTLPPNERDPLVSCGYKCNAKSDTELCSQAGAECGQISVTDRCGTRGIACGVCTSPETCGGGGTPNVCACVPESNVQFCARQGKNCGTVTGQDNCGDTRSVSSCGTCASGQSCGGGGTPNVCGCTVETDAQFCARLGKNCGTVTGQDSCGQYRSVSSCGTCGGTNWCTANVCRAQTNDCDDAPVPSCAPPGSECHYEPSALVCISGTWHCGDLVCDGTGEIQP